jgi:hypothetical protein
VGYSIWIFKLIEYEQKVNYRVVSFSVTNQVEENKMSEEVFAASADCFLGSNSKPRKRSTSSLQDFNTVVVVLPTCQHVAG